MFSEITATWNGKEQKYDIKALERSLKLFFVDWIIISDNFGIIAVKSTKNNSRNAIGIYFAFLTCHFHFTFLFFLSFSIKKHFLEIQSNEICIWNFQFFFCFFSHFFPIAVSILFHVIKHPKYNTVGVASFWMLILKEKNFFPCFCFPFMRVEKL